MQQTESNLVLNNVNLESGCQFKTTHPKLNMGDKSLSWIESTIRKNSAKLVQYGKTFNICYM